MACTTTSNNINIEGASVAFGAESIDCITAAIGLVGGESIHISNPTTDYYIWFTVDSTGVDPAPTGRTAIAVALPATYTLAELHTLTIAAVEATGEFLVAVSSDSLSFTIKALEIGVPNDATADVDTSFTFEIIKAGFGGDLGKLKSAVELSMEIELFDVLANASGSSILDRIVTGNSANISVELLEMTADKWESVVGDGFGGKLTSDTQVVGYGSGQINKSAFDVAGKLIIHPTRLDASDRSRDITFPKTAASPSSINFDGTDTQAMTVEFAALVDSSIDSEVDLFFFGDWKQDLR